MRQFRLALVALLTCLTVVNAVFLRKAITFLLFGLLSFNSTAYYELFGRGEVATAAVPPMGIAPSTLPHSAPISSVSQPIQEELILAANPSPVSLEGKWQSEWGVVEFNANLTGRWNQGGGIGQITSGSYDSKTRKLVFQYYQPWNNMTGTGTFTLSEDGNRLSGTWSQQPRGSNRPGSGGSGGWTMTREKPVSCTSNVSIAGEWRSDWGQVKFNSNLSGSWNQPGSGVGQIKSGSFDSKKCKLVFQYYQSWNDMDGTATLVLSENGNRLAGTWIQQRRGSNRIGSGGSGSWIMTRDASNEIAKPNKEETLPEQGDIVIYRASNGNGAITHSGVITGVRPDGTITQIKSKWGGQGLYLHDPNDSVYGKSWTVWRAKRKDGSRNNLLIVRPTRKFPLNLANGYYTDKDRLITTFLTGYAEEGDAKSIKEHIQNHKGKSPIVELEPPTTNYNCHGFTFTGGRQAVPPTQVQYILNDNGYFLIKVVLDSDGNPH
ncbi:MAG: hypothetical protein HC860_02380 [Alkalinema sp. RU_4_3]|nr:hypothetical protein [Alkalinema sp. RU_4_3]